MENITYDDFKKLEMRIGWIRFVEPVKGTDKLLRFEIDFGPLSEVVPDLIRDPENTGELPLVCVGECTPADCTHADDETCDCESNCECDVAEPAFGKIEYAGRDMRQIVSGIREFFPKFKSLEGKKALYIVNLEPREIRGVMSHGMLMAVDGLDGKPVFLTAEGTVEAGSQVR